MARQNHSYGPVTTDHATLYFVESGCLNFVVSGERQVTGCVKASHFLWVPPRHCRQVWTDATGLFMYALVLDQSADALPALPYMPLPAHPVLTESTNASHIGRLFRSAEVSCISTESWNRMEAEGCAILILAQFVKSCTPPDIQPHLLRQVRLIMQYMSHNYQRPELNIKEMLTTVSWSQRHFFRAFRVVTGMTPMQYLQELRLNSAFELLATREFTVTEVAHRCGFQDPAYFSRMFSRKNNRPPSSLL